MRRGAACTGWAVGMAMIVGVGATQSSLPRNRAETNRSAVTVTVLVYNYAGVEARTQTAAQQEASRILGRAGVNLVWHSCGNGARHAVSDPGCSPVASESAIKVRLVKSVQNLSGMTDDATLGYSAGRLATVSYERVQEISADGNVDVEYVLGHAMAHELGHLLLPGRPHAVEGIMRANWKDQDLSLMRRHGLNFLPAEMVLIRANAEILGSGKATVSIASER